VVVVVRQTVLPVMVAAVPLVLLELRTLVVVVVLESILTGLLVVLESL
jgi:hypothetical protein